MLYNLIIAPIEFIVDWIFRLCLNKVGTHGVIYCVVVVSIVINILALPLYNIADALQEKERKIAKKLEPRVKRIKKAFKGDEQFMMLSEYYRQNNYHPLYVLRSSLSILIEIPFFIAAYHYLSNCEALLGSHFWIFKDLGRPDELFKFTIGTKLIIINILPIIMTLINFVSGAVYTKEAPMKEKVQLYVVACIFLVLLYNSPSGLVIYWILNNLFSLAKNIVLKMKRPGMILFSFIAICLCGLTVIFWIKHPETDLFKKEFLTLITLLFCFSPLLLSTFKKQNWFISINKSLEQTPTASSKALYIFSSLSLFLLLGFVLPTSIIGSSPIEFCCLASTKKPVHYIWTTFCFFFSFCFLWPFIIYKMFGNKTKNIMSLFFFSILISVLCNTYIFKFQITDLNPTFKVPNKSLYDVPLIFSLYSFIVFMLSFICIYIIQNTKIKKYITFFLLSFCIAEIGFGIYKTNYTNITAKRFIENTESSSKQKTTIEPVYHLSKEDNNVIIIFLDRCLNTLFPYSLKQFPEIKEQFKGFTYYPNTLSFGPNTLTGYSSITGGYEYTPENMNKRTDKKLRDKHNESLMIMPKIFMDAGFSATVTDPSYSNYFWSGDLSPYEKFPQINVSEQIGLYSSFYRTEKNIPDIMGTIGDKICDKQIKNFVILQSLFPILRLTFYNTTKTSEINSDYFIDNISNLYYLKKLTSFDNSKPSYIFIGNETCHNAVNIYSLTDEYSYHETASFTFKDNTVSQDYDIHTAVFNMLGNYFDFLRENNVYDNTRIIIVSDHGRDRNLNDFQNFKEPSLPASYNPLLLVKDFNSNNDLITDNTFMTNADTLFLAKEGLNISDTNPFTGNKFVQEKDKGCQLLTYKDNTCNTVDMYDAYKFSIQKSAYHVHDNIFDPANWTKIELDGGNK